MGAKVDAYCAVYFHRMKKNAGEILCENCGLTGKDPCARIGAYFFTEQNAKKETSSTAAQPQRAGDGGSPASEAV